MQKSLASICCPGCNHRLLSAQACVFAQPAATVENTLIANAYHRRCGRKQGGHKTTNSLNQPATWPLSFATHRGGESENASANHRSRLATETGSVSAVTMRVRTVEL